MNADSVKTRLKNFAVSSGCTFQEALVYYGLERISSQNLNAPLEQIMLYAVFLYSSVSLVQENMLLNKKLQVFFHCLRQSAFLE